MSDSPYLYLSVSQIRELHDALIGEHGGVGGTPNAVRLKTCVEAPQSVALLQEGDVFEQASAYTCTILRKSPFQDGNRRTALVAALVFLEINGVVDHDYDESMLLQAMLYLAEGKMDRDLFAQFLREAISGITGSWQDESPDL